MEWIIAIAVAVLLLVWALIFLGAKLLRLKPLASKLLKLAAALEQASAKVPEIQAMVSNLADDPAVMVAKRLKLQRVRRKLKSQQERRLRSRVL